MEEEKERIFKTSKRKIWLVVILIIAVGIFIFSLWFKKLIADRQEASKVLNVYEIVEQEVKRCSQYLSKQGGEFAEYEYCKKFLDKFSDKINID